MRYSFYLGEMVPDPNDKEKAVSQDSIPYIEEKDFEPVQIIDDEKYVATGAVRSSSVYGSPETRNKR